MTREIKIEEVKQHNNEKSVWMIIHNEVYDVTKFLNEHPGGADSLLDYAGEDGTQAFEDVGHSDDAREMMEQYKIGTLPADQRIVAPGGTTQLNRDVLVLAATSDCGSGCRDPKDPTKPWRTFDGTRSANRSRRGSGNAQSPPPSSGSNLKWALFALAGAIVIGIAMKKYLS